MESNFNDLMKSFFDNQKNITERGISLIRLSDFISKEESKKEYIDEFLYKLESLEYRTIEKIIDSPLTTNDGIDYYLCLLLSDLYKYSNLNIVLKIMKNIGRDVSENFYEKNNSNIITVDKVEEVWCYIADNFKYFNMLYPFEYSIIEYSHKEYDSISIYEADFDRGGFWKFFFFNVKDENLSPIYILIHEFGHYIHAKYSKGKMNINTKILKKLKKTDFYKIEEIMLKEQAEIFANILAMGIMYNSPYEIYDPFTEISKKDKAIFHELVKEILEYYYQNIYVE